MQFRIQPEIRLSVHRIWSFCLSLVLSFLGFLYLSVARSTPDSPSSSSSSQKDWGFYPAFSCPTYPKFKSCKIGKLTQCHALLPGIDNSPKYMPTFVLFPVPSGSYFLKYFAQGLSCVEGQSNKSYQKQIIIVFKMVFFSNYVELSLVTQLF